MTGDSEMRLWRCPYEDLNTPEAGHKRTQAALSDACTPDTRAIALECPVAIETNGIAYAVMMATPLDIEDFVTGFLVAEGIASAAQIGEIAVHEVESGEWGRGLVTRVTLPPECLGPILERARRRLGDSSCGICGIEGIEAALRPLPRIDSTLKIAPSAVRRALGALREGQDLGNRTRATHAAGFFTPVGALLCLREDVGRHNALDKLTGALARRGVAASGGFIVMTSRCSYELVEKAARAGCPLLVTISAPSELAVRRAEAAGLALCVVAREDSMLLTQIGPGSPFVEE